MRKNNKRQKIIIEYIKICLIDYECMLIKSTSCITISRLNFFTITNALLFFEFFFLNFRQLQRT